MTVSTRMVVRITNSVAGEGILPVGFYCWISLFIVFCALG
uniref:Uncharacterized protein n=1 Tax=Arundo donax TaxID=35708 RepID=A0A0A9JNR0_ARUDO